MVRGGRLGARPGARVEVKGTARGGTGGDASACARPRGTREGRGPGVAEGSARGRCGRRALRPLARSVTARGCGSWPRHGQAAAAAAAWSSLPAAARNRLAARPGAPGGQRLPPRSGAVPLGEASAVRPCAPTLVGAVGTPVRRDPLPEPRDCRLLRFHLVTTTKRGETPRPGGYSTQWFVSAPGGRVNQPGACQPWLLAHQGLCN